MTLMRIAAWQAPSLAYSVTADYLERLTADRPPAPATECLMAYGMSDRHAVLDALTAQTRSAVCQMEAFTGGRAEYEEQGCLHDGLHPYAVEGLYGALDRGQPWNLPAGGCADCIAAIVGIMVGLQLQAYGLLGFGPDLIISMCRANAFAAGAAAVQTAQHRS